MFGSESKQETQLFFDSSSLNCGEIARYKIQVSNCSENQQIFFKFKNTLSLLLRPLYITGPFTFYVDCRPFGYDEDKEFSEEIQFSPDIKPDEVFSGILKCNANSYNGDCYEWTVDVMSQLSIMSAASIDFVFELLADADTTITSENINVVKHDAYDLWEAPPVSAQDDVHLVIVTHGIFSNIGCDMAYIRDKIEKRGLENNQNLMIRGYMGNIGKSHKGLEYLGSRLAKYILNLVEEESKFYNITKISFIGHSLGGPVQTFAIEKIFSESPGFFEKVKPENLIFMAAPMLGVACEVPAYVSLALDLGSLGKTGRDLKFKHRNIIGRPGLQSNKPILETTPKSPIFQQFKQRTLYANVLNDGIVPLRTSALLYLDWHAVADLYKLFSTKGMGDFSNNISNNAHSSEIPVLKENPSLNTDATNEEDDKEDLSSDSSSEESDDNVHSPDSRFSGFDLEHFKSLNIKDHIKKKRYSKYRRIQVRNAKETKNDNESPDSPKHISKDDLEEIPSPNKEEQIFNPPPKASAFLSAAQCIFADLPNQEYITNPASRELDIILHDSVYDPTFLPAPHYADRSTFKKLIYLRDKIHRKEERIARYWQEKMSWRKVLVVLQPESHNNIAVRRRFINLFGNVAIKNMVETHF